MSSPPLAFQLHGDVAIVSGAGSQMSGEIGNGRAIAIVLARQGAKVALLDNNITAAEETKKMIDAEGGTSEAIHCDVTDEASCKAAVEKTVQLFGAVHILVNVVGIFGPLGDVTQVDIDGWERGLRVNVTSMVLMSRYAIIEMRKSQRGAIVNLSSVSGLIGGNPGIHYTTSKGAIIQLTKAMAAHHGPEQIRVNCIAPGMVYTPMVRGPQGMSEETRQARKEQSLLKIEGTPWDVAHAALYLVSHEAKYVTGVILPVDGGTLAGTHSRPKLPHELV
ncbi:short-chain dehydrogenase reductase sdr [Moniliophthora roreri MCA 2997]|uniref:Short-chain dehydrogenase reductase sdr n=2 Tax=Moniliophthora roreri TaxID=221103 RepID=V2XNK6_MONRO|nr:short-chain dehydrogenase reductase sdr [Moniliophthora roreri MCA 2997]